MGATRRQIRRDVLRAVGDLRILTATADGSDVTFIDTVSLVGETGAYRGREVIFTGGTTANLGEIRYVTGSSSQQRGIGFGIALPAATATGDEAEMLNTRGTGFRIQDVHDAINQAIRGIANRALVPAGTDDLAYARGNAIIAPADFATIENVQWKRANDQCAEWRSLPKATRPNGFGWSVDPATREVVIAGRPGWWIDGGTVKVWGLAPPPELFDDGDETKLDPEWLTNAAAALLLRARYLRMPTPETERLVYMLSQKADALERRATSRRSPFSVSLR